MNPRQNTRGARRSKRAESAARRGTIPPPLCPKLTVPVVRDLRHGARSASVLARPVSLRYAALLFFSLASRGGAFSIDHLWARESRNPSVRGDQAGMPKRAAGGRFRVLRPPPPAQYPKTQTRNVGRYFQKIFPRTFPSADAFFCIQLNGTKSNPPRFTKPEQRACCPIPWAPPGSRRHDDVRGRVRRRRGRGALREHLHHES